MWLIFSRKSFFRSFELVVYGRSLLFLRCSSGSVRIWLRMATLCLMCEASFGIDFDMEVRLLVRLQRTLVAWESGISSRSKLLEQMKKLDGAIKSARLQKSGHISSWVKIFRNYMECYWWVPIPRITSSMVTPPSNARLAATSLHLFSMLGSLWSASQHWLNLDSFRILQYLEQKQKCTSSVTENIIDREGQSRDFMDRTCLNDITRVMHSSNIHPRLCPFVMLIRVKGTPVQRSWCVSFCHDRDWVHCLGAKATESLLVRA